MPAGRREDRDGRLARRLERAAGQRGLDDLLHRQREEEHHADVVDGEMQRVREALVAGVVDVRPDQPGDGAGREEQRVLDDEGPDGAAPRSVIADGACQPIR